MRLMEKNSDWIENFISVCQNQDFSQKISKKYS